MNSLFLLILATTILVMIPGPNVALIVANSLRYGLRMGVMTVLGTTAGGSRLPDLARDSSATGRPRVSALHFHVAESQLFALLPHLTSINFR